MTGDRRRFTEEEMQAFADVVGKAVAKAVTESLVDALEKKLTEKFYINLGKSTWSILYKAIIATSISIILWFLSKKH